MIPSDDQRPVPLLILDLDGTVRFGKDELGHFVNSPDDVKIFPEAIDRMAAWKARGGRIIGVSNQGGVALGIVTRAAAQAAVAETNRQTGGLFDAALLCPHHPQAPDPAMRRCWCRKPRAGLAIEAATILTIHYPNDYYPADQMLVVGDRDEDRGCAQALSADFLPASAWREDGPTSPLRSCPV